MAKLNIKIEELSVAKNSSQDYSQDYYSDEDYDNWVDDQIEQRNLK